LEIFSKGRLMMSFSNFYIVEAQYVVSFFYGLTKEKIGLVEAV